MNPSELPSLSQAPSERHAPIPGWILGLGVILSFWAGGYLFFYSGGFRGDVYDAGQITWGPVSTGPVAPPDPKVIGKRLYTANCAQCHQATGLGQAGVYPPLAESEWVLGSKSRLIAIRESQGLFTSKGTFTTIICQLGVMVPPCHLKMTRFPQSLLTFVVNGEIMLAQSKQMR